MKTLKFKTNIKCSGCLETVRPFLNDVSGEDNWQVDLNSVEKILTVSSEDGNSEKIIEAAKKAGYTIEEQLN